MLVELVQTSRLGGDGDTGGGTRGDTAWRAAPRPDARAGRTWKWRTRSTSSPRSSSARGVRRVSRLRLGSPGVACDPSCVAHVHQIDGAIVCTKCRTIHVCAEQACGASARCAARALAVGALYRERRGITLIHRCTTECTFEDARALGNGWDRVFFCESTGAPHLCNEEQCACGSVANVVRTLSSGRKCDGTQLSCLATGNPLQDFSPSRAPKRRRVREV